MSDTPLALVFTTSFDYDGNAADVECTKPGILKPGETMPPFCRMRLPSRREPLIIAVTVLPEEPLGLERSIQLELDALLRLTAGGGAA